VPNGSYTVSVSNTGFTFTPPSQPVTIAGSLSATGVNFTGQPIPTWTISGTVTGGGSATVSLTGAATKTATADGSGNYSFTGLLDGSYTVTPTKSGYTMSPASQPVSVSGANVANVNFTAQPIPTYSISGTISPTPLGAGATVTLSGGATGTTTTDASGNYSFGGLLNGTYTVAPTKTGVIMTPTSRAVTISNANVGAVNFTASAPALSIDASVSTGRSTKATTIASPAFTTTAGNELILAFVAMDDANANGITVTGVSGAGLTWTLVRRTNTSRGGSEIWRAFAPSVLTGVTATATLSQNIAAAITIVTFKGVDTTGTNGSGAIGATASGSAASGGPTASLTTTRAGSLVIGVGNDWDSDTSRTLGPNQTLVSQFLATVGDTFWVQRTSTTITAAGTVVTINDTAPTGDQYNLTICEVLSGS
jgi:Cna protein B-type domain.